MAALSAPDATLWRTSPYRYTGCLYIDKPEVVFKARVNQASFVYPLVQVTFDGVTVGAFGDIQNGFTVLFGTSDGADDLGRQRAKSATSTVLTIGESSQGDHDGEVDLADNAYITVLNERRLWGIPPRFDTATATAYKDYNIEVDSGGRNYASDPGPKANGGAWRVALVNPATGLATFEFADESLYVTPGSVFASRLWDEQDGTITVGTSTSANPTMTFPVGRRYVSLTVTDDNGHSHTHYILVVALDPDDATWKPIRQFEIVDQRNTIVGGELSVLVHEDIAASTYYDGAAVLYFETEIFGTTTGSLAGPATLEHIKFVGWLDTERESPTATLRGIQKGTELRCISAAERLRQINLLPQLMKYKGSPDAWDEMANLTNARVLWYLLRWHSTALELCNLYLTANGWDSLIKRWATTASTLYDQAVEAAKARAQLFTCDQRGMLRIVQNSLVLSDSTGERSNVDIVALTEADAISVSLERNRFPGTYWLDGSGITIGTDTEDIIPVFARAPGNAPGQGAQRTSFAGLIVDSQDEMNIWTGNEYARINAPWLPARIQLKYTGDAGIDPALGEWITLTLPSTTNRRGRTFTAQRFMPVEVSIQHSNDAVGIKEVEIVAVIETSGAPAETVSIPAGSTNRTIYGTVNVPPPTVPPPSQSGGPGSFQLYTGINRMALVTSDGYLMLTNDFSAASPVWEQISLGVAAVIDDAVADAFSPGYLASTGEINCWFATKTGIYLLEDIFNTGSGRTVTLQHTFATATPTETIAQLDSPFGAAGYIACCQHTSAGLRVIHSEDAGANWTETLLSSARYTGAATGIFSDVFYSTRIAGLLYATAFTANNTPWLYKSTDYGVNWTQISPTASGGAAPLLCIHVPWHNNGDQALVYYGFFTGSAISANRVQAGVSSPVLIGPVISGSDLGPQGHWGITSHVEDRQRMAMVGTNAAATVIRLLTSVDGGTTWTEKQVLSSASSYYTAAFIAGNDGNTLYLWGYDGVIGYSQDFGTTLQDKRGNMPTDFPTTGRIVRIFGG